MPYREYRLDYHLFPDSDIPYVVYDMLPFAQEKYLIKANQPVLRYGIYNKAQHLLRPVYTEYPVECISSGK